MKRARVNGAELEYEIRGEGEPVLLIHGAHIADAMAPLMSASALEGFQLIRYHRRGFAGSSSLTGPTPAEVLADDAGALLGVLGLDAAHVVGHSSGAVIAIELGARHPRRVLSLSLLEPPVLSSPAGVVFWQLVGPLEARFRNGDPAGAVEGFLALVGDSEWRSTIERAVPGGVEQAQRDAATFYESELRAVGSWTFDRQRASAITCPVLSVLGTASGPLFAEGRAHLHEWFDNCADADLAGVSHLLQMEDTDGVADAVGRFLRSLAPAATGRHAEASASRDV
jgi:pimeloyl-ACP methyl ester carboxylesterase